MNNIQNLRIFGWFSFNQQQALKMYNEKRLVKFVGKSFLLRLLSLCDCLIMIVLMIASSWLNFCQDCFSLRLFFLKDCFSFVKSIPNFWETGWDWGGQKFACSKQILGVFSNFFKKILKIFQLFFALKTAIFANTRQDAPLFCEFPKISSKNF